MDNSLDDPEKFWAALLSEDAAQIREAWERLDADEAAAVRAHLEAMIADEEFSDSQRQAARAALQAIGPVP